MSLVISFLSTQNSYSQNPQPKGNARLFLTGAQLELARYAQQMAQLLSLWSHPGLMENKDQGGGQASPRTLARGDGSCKGRPQVQAPSPTKLFPLTCSGPG